MEEAEEEALEAVEEVGDKGGGSGSEGDHQRTVANMYAVTMRTRPCTCESSWFSWCVPPCLPYLGCRCVASTNSFTTSAAGASISTGVKYAPSCAATSAARRRVSAELCLYRRGAGVGGAASSVGSDRLVPGFDAVPRGVRRSHE